MVFEKLTTQSEWLVPMNKDGEVDWGLWNILPFFRDWEIIQKKEHSHIMKRGKNITWWVTMILRSSLSSTSGG